MKIFRNYNYHLWNQIVPFSIVDTDIIIQVTGPFILKNINSGRPNVCSGRWSVQWESEEMRQSSGIRGDVKLWNSNWINVSPCTLMPWPHWIQADVVFRGRDCNLSLGPFCPVAVVWWQRGNLGCRGLLLASLQLWFGHCPMSCKFSIFFSFW